METSERIRRARRPLVSGYPVPSGRGATVWTLLLLLVVGLGARAALAQNRKWTDEVFESKVSAGRPFLVSANMSRTHSVIGSSRFYQVEQGDTFLDVARYYGLGYNEIVEANPGVDAWIPPPGQMILLPTQWVLPNVEFRGVVVNIPEMRLYYFHPAGAGTIVVNTFPVGLGRDDWRTPEGKFRIQAKTVNPTWVLPESIREEHRKDGRPAPRSIAGGAPDNPLGKYRFKLSLPLYGIHGTNIPWGVGMQVSHGCVRLYPEDIERLFPMVPVGTPGAFVYQPVKVGMLEGHVYVEVHKDIYRLQPALYRTATRLIEQAGWQARVDPDRLKRAVLEQSGVPIDVTLRADWDEVADEVLESADRTGEPAHPELHTLSHGRPR